ncbi:hypothetical protein GCM10009775_29110 [Microbacterium aoyamense]|uniref:DUF4192 domain-containing protein n=1 Tax=Microbacterium aoyamense TaxID=344166 RepID=A0ABP5BAY8_9MICO|nr:DUF4192 family protein [Microbacterium aoyamense]
MNTTPTIVKTSDPVDLIALLPTLAGTPLRNSFVVAPFVGKRTVGALRIDLPSHESPDVFAALANVLLGNLERIRGCSGAAIVIYTDEPYVTAFDAWDPLQVVLCEQFMDAGLRIVASLLVAGDAWERFDERSPLGQSLALVEASAAFLPERPEEPWALPQADLALAQRVAAGVEDIVVFGEERSALGVYRPAEPLEPIPFLERLLSHDSDDIGPATIARLVTMMQSEGDVDRTVLQIAFGAKTGAASWRRTLEVRALAAQAGTTPHEYLMKHDRDNPGTRRIGDLLTGQTSEMPSPRRLQRGAALLARVAVHAPPMHQPHLLCALAWVLWAQGLSSAAHELLARCLRTAPEHPLAIVFHTAWNALPLPDWVFVRAAAEELEVSP